MAAFEVRPDVAMSRYYRLSLQVNTGETWTTSRYLGIYRIRCISPPRATAGSRFCRHGRPQTHRFAGIAKTAI